MPFKTKLEVEFIDGKNWLLDAPLLYITKRGDDILVPDGFLTDFASIPRVLRSVIGDAAGPYAPAAVVHDFLYRTGLVPRAEADAIFREAMGELKIPRQKRWTMWLGVRLGGWAAYRSAAPVSVE
jgi:hypothetical protein